MPEITPELWLQLGPIVVFVWFVVQIAKLVLEYLSSRKEGGTLEESGKMMEAIDNLDKQVCTLVSKIGDLYEWHNVKDPRTGTMVWYSSFQNSALQETLTHVSETLVGITNVLKEISAQNSISEVRKFATLKSLSEQGLVTKEAIASVQAELNALRRDMDVGKKTNR